MKVLNVPYRIKALSELRDHNKSLSFSLPYSAMLVDETFLTKLLKDKDPSKFKFLCSLSLRWVIVTDPKKMTSSTDFKVLYGITAESLSGKASVQELFDCVQVSGLSDKVTSYFLQMVYVQYYESLPFFVFLLRGYITAFPGFISKNSFCVCYLLHD
jgi:hypothetical protein